MATVAIVYHSDTGSTQIAAEAVARGVARHAGSIPVPLAVVSADITDGRWSNDILLEQVDACDAVVFGSPTYMGGYSAQLKSFFDSTLDRYAARTWSHKVAAGFTVSSTPGGDKLQTLVGMATFAMQMGMIWVGLDQLPMNDDGLNRLSYYFGAAVQADYSVDQPAIDARDEATATLLGERVARIASQLAS